MKNTLGDLNNHLFAQLEKLGDEDLNGEQMDAEIRRAEAMAKIGEQIIKTGELQLKAMIHMDEYGYERAKAVPEMLEVRGGGEVSVEDRECTRPDNERSNSPNQPAGFQREVRNGFHGGNHQGGKKPVSYSERNTDRKPERLFRKIPERDG